MTANPPTPPRTDLATLAGIVSSTRLSLEHAEDMLLRADGCKATSATPDFCWRWEKEIDGRLWAFGRETALKIAMDAHLTTEDEDDIAF